MNDQVKKQGYGFAKYPFIRLYKYTADEKTKKMKFEVEKQLLFGDYIRLICDAAGPVTRTLNKKTYVKVSSRSEGYVLEKDILPDRILEVNFIDVGQGDGCHLVTPDDRHFIIDAGAGDNMYRFLKWRFNLKKSKHAPPPFTAVVSHSDTDHYRGFGKVFSATKGFAQQLKFDKIYHNGLVEISGKTLDSLGKLTGDKKFVTGLCDTNTQFKNLAGAQQKPGQYISTLLKSDAPKESLRHGHSPIYDKGNLLVEVAGPCPATINGKDALPVFENDKGKTKNGNSVILKITMGHMRLLLGGDLNTSAEDYILGYYSGKDVTGIREKLAAGGLTDAKRKDLEKALETATGKARAALNVDVAKSCHHGSSDFTSEFLLAMNPFCTVISSGDEESYAHPRPETLGAIGKYSRSDRPMIFSTELGRSSPEFIDLKEFTAAKKKERTVTVYGMINLRTDGNKAIIAQKLEKKAKGRGWDIHCLEWSDSSKEWMVPKKK